MQDVVQIDFGKKESLDEFKIVSWCPRNIMTNSSTSNFLISQKLCQLDEGTRMNRNCLRRVHMLNLSQYLVTNIPISPMATLKQHLMVVLLLSPCTLGMLLTSKPRIQDIWKSQRTHNKKKPNHMAPKKKGKEHKSPKKKTHIVGSQVINQHTSSIAQQCK